MFGQAVSGTIDGEVVSGIDAIDHISGVTTTSGDVPVDEIPTIVRIELEGECDSVADSVCKAFIYIDLL